MKVKKVIAGGLAAAAAGATLLFGAMAASTSLGNYVTVSDSSLSSPTIVIGTQTANLADQYPNDVVGAADIAAAVAGFATTPVVAGGGTTVSVSGGADVSTGNTKIYLGDTLTKPGIKTTITRTNLPDLLPQGTFYDNGGTSYTFNQYITFGAGTVEFGTSGGDLADPKLYINTGTSTSAPLLNMTVVFNKVLNLSNSDVRGMPITLFGKEYTIGSESVYDSTGGTKLVLFGGGGSTQVIAEGQEVTMTAAGVNHQVKVVGVSSTTQAVVSIDGVTQTVTKGQTKTIGGISVYTKDIFYFGKEAQVSQVELSLGASKIILENGAAVKTGQTEDTVDGTLVTLTGTLGQGISKLDVSITAASSTYDSIVEGASFTDPVFSAVKLAFGGLNLGTEDQVTIDNAGTTQASLKFTDYRGNTKTIYWAYATAGGSSFNAQLNDSSTRSYHVIEGDTVYKNDYVLLAPSQESEFGHIFQYTTASSIGSTGSYIELKDVISGDTTRIYLNDPGLASSTFYIDGQPYYVKNVTSSAQTFQFTWGTGASAGNTGNATVAFPLIKAKNGEYITLFKNTSLGNASGLYYNLPGSTDGVFITNATSSVTVGRLDYKLTAGVAFATLVSINKTADVGVSTTAPSVLVYEEKGKDLASGTDRQDAVLVTVADGSGSGLDMTIQPPVQTAATTYSGSQTTDNSVTEYYDRYGAHVKYDTDGQGLITVDYPDDQATAMVGIGSNPSFSSSTGTAGTVNAAVQIKSPVTKFDSEVSTTSLNTDLILLGGPCAKSLVATLLSSENTTCTSDANGFVTKYPNGVIKEVESAFGSTHKALIVAGVNGPGTRSLATKVMQGTLSFQ